MNNYAGPMGGGSQYQPNPYVQNQTYQIQAAPNYYQQQQHHHQGPYHTNTSQNSRHRASNPQACYNCGNVGHWAQDCPEPKRANPAGANQPRPAKRLKTSGPIITRYPPPSQGYSRHNQPGRKFSNGYNYNQTGYQQHPGQYGPPTPNSAYGQTYQQWPLQSPQQYSPQYQQNSPYGPYGLPTPASSHGSQFPSPASGHPSSQSQTFFPPQGGPAPNSRHRRSDASSRQNSWASDRGSYSRNAHSARLSVGPSRQSSYTSETSPVSQLEPWMEELQGLDIPENSTIGSHINGRQLVWKPANPVAMPLPSTFSEAEKIGFMPVAATLSEGAPVSKYFKDLNEEQYLLHVSDSSHWKEVEDDPCFCEISEDDDYVPFEDLIQRRNELWGLDRHMDLESEEGEVPDRDVNLDSDEYFHPQPVSLESLPNSPTDLPVQTSQEAGPDERFEVDKNSEAAQSDTEAKLAALGVTGAPKPVYRTSQLSIGEERNPTDMDPHDSSKRQRSRSTSSREDVDSRRYSGNFAPPRSYAWPYKNPNRGESLENDTETAIEAHEIAIQSHSPLTKKISQANTSPESPTANPRMEKQPHDVTNGHRGRQPNSLRDSHLHHASDRNNHRKRSFKRDSSEESNEGPRRQEDDSRHKNKRRQANVADAYSRRW